MSFNVFVIVCLSAVLFTSGIVDAYPQQTFNNNNNQQHNVQPINETCLGCICESISSCDPNLKCVGDICGIFAITWAYWSDSGKPVVQGDNPNNGQAYANCANNPICAKQSVTNYLNRFAQDCNNDGVIDCWDYASIHKLGGYGCTAPLDPSYKNKYITCQNTVNQLSGSMIIFPERNNFNDLPPNAPK